MKSVRIVSFGLALLLGGFLSLIAVPAALSQSSAIRAHPYRPYTGMSVSLEVVSDGQAMTTVEHNGRTYLPVRWGQEYSLRITNNGPRRIAAVVSVDGLSVITGKPAAASGSGYVVDAHSSLTIRGWRRNMDTVAAFSFQPRGESYAAKMGRPENVGVIGLAAFEEQTYDYRPLPRLADGAYGKKSASAPSSDSKDESTRAPSAVGGTGTSYGRDLDSPVQYVNFVRSSNRRTVTIYYDTRRALREAGIIVDDVRPTPIYPQPFPREDGFAPPPPGDWRR